MTLLLLGRREEEVALLREGERLLSAIAPRSSGTSAIAETRELIVGDHVGKRTATTVLP